LIKFLNLINKNKIFLFLKNRLFFESYSNGVKIIRLLFLATFLQHIFAWLFVEFFGDYFWFDASEEIVKSELLSATADGGYVEHFANMYLFWSFLLSSFLTFKYFRNSFAITFFYLFLFLDDSLSIHERFASKIFPDFYKRIFGFTFNSQWSNITELLFWLFPLLIMLFTITVSYKKMKLEEKKFVFNNFFFFILLALFSVGIDQMITIPWVSENLWHGSAFSSFSSFMIIFLNQVEEWGEVFSVGFAFLWLYNYACLTLNKKMLI